MVTIVRRTTELQRLAARRRPWRAALALALAGAGAPALLAALALAALHHGQVSSAGALLLLALLAGVLVGLARRASLAALGWLLLRVHCLVSARRAEAGCASARVRALAHVKNYLCCIAARRCKLISSVSHIIIGNRLLPHVGITPRVKAQRPN